jgi:undecaprenyl-diphosphatase
MKEKGDLRKGAGLLAAFGLWTLLIQTVDIRAAGPEGTTIGLAAFNVWVHTLTGVHMALYTITDWLGLVPIGICCCFGVLGLVQLIRRRSLRRVDPDLLLLGAYYLVVIAGYLVFEMIPINYRPVLIDGRLEASYPSSTTLLVLSVMPTLRFQADRRIKRSALRKAAAAAAGFSAFMVIGRLASGVHWATDIIASVLLSGGLFLLYRAAVAHADAKREAGEHGVQ